MKRYLYLLFFLISCAENDAAFNSSVPLVVEAYLFENKPVENIKLSFVRGINNQSNLVAASGASAFIIWKGIFYPLVETSRPGFYSAEDESLQIKSGETYELYINYMGENHEAEATVPPSPSQLMASKDTLEFSDNDDFIDITWNNPDSLWHLGVISDINPASTEFPFNNFFSIPTQASKLDIKPNNLQSTGNKLFIIYGITDEYQELYRISNSTLASSYAGNVSNGFGIFAAFSSDTLSFVVK